MARPSPSRVSLTLLVVAAISALDGQSPLCAFSTARAIAFKSDGQQPLAPEKQAAEEKRLVEKANRGVCSVLSHVGWSDVASGLGQVGKSLLNDLTREILCELLRKYQYEISRMRGKTLHFAPPEGWARARWRLRRVIHSGRFRSPLFPSMVIAVRPGAQHRTVACKGAFVTAAIWRYRIGRKCLGPIQPQNGSRSHVMCRLRFGLSCLRTLVLSEEPNIVVEVFCFVSKFVSFSI